MQIFSPNLKRSELLALSKKINFTQIKEININIYRNHAFEPIESVIAPFLHYAGFRANFTYGDYDESLSFNPNINTNSNLAIIFLDLARYKLSEADFIAFLQERASALQDKLKTPLLILLLNSNSLSSKTIAHSLQPLKTSQIYTFSCDELFTHYLSLSLLNPMSTLLDESKESIAGTRLSNAATLILAQILGLKLIPSLLLPNLKAIVLDLDNTMYNGILGEDGIDNIELTPTHKALQNAILELKKQGYLLAIASKNEKSDVKRLFETRVDFPLKWSDFDAIEAHWDTKDKSLQNIAKAFNIGLDSMLFIDDNLAEIESTKHTQVKQIHAQNPQSTIFTLFLFPQLTKLRISTEDALRANDIKANAMRESLESLSDKEYFHNLKIELEFAINPKTNAQRIYELMNKTNQFIANYTRPTQAQVQEWLDSKNHCVISIAMRDRLSDSGIIGIIVGEKKDREIHILDIVVSCRALGRRLESIMLFNAFALIAQSLQDTQKAVLLHYQKGERNKPFLQTLQTLQGVDLQNLSKSSLSIPLQSPSTEGLTILISKEQQ
ncbi:HAD-IIIC family phosphatase [Helicobacter cinaedi]|uniref:HAD-IIIC family phosphatase n=1 Tax=Helicobacter cinaedi TaxID=213 RepID=UPI000CF1125F|nr:HAD-IIIC family phosphatase [Helicobacter cinaedi]AWK61930.1 HAD-IIIC family phosphatase [Helicobacter cinaedi]QOQ96027.1 HAD-IIIC family phosphatase [Helicobacter cinaedi]